VKRNEKLEASIVITTRGRCTDLRRALLSCQRQINVSFEVLVYDDASEDETASIICTEFPTVRLFRSTSRRGYIALRNKGYRDARSDVIVSIDDDAEFSSCDTLRCIVEMFKLYPTAGAVAISFIEPSRCPLGAMTETPSGTRLRNFIGCAHAVCRQVFLEVGGYPELLVHQGEERDFCIRLLDAGKEIVYLNHSPIVHHASPIREVGRVNFYGYRNTILFPFMRFPIWAAIPRIATSSIQLLFYKFRFSRFPYAVGGILAGYFACIQNIGARRPVSSIAYANYRALPSHGPLDSRNVKEQHGLRFSTPARLNRHTT